MICWPTNSFRNVGDRVQLVMAARVYRGGASVKAGRPSIGGVALFLDQGAAAEAVDLAFKRRAAVVGDVNRAGEGDEGVVEGPGALQHANLVLDAPEFGVDALQPLAKP